MPPRRLRASAAAFIPLNRVPAAPALRRCGIPASIGRAARSPILPCTGLGLSCLPRRLGSGELLPRLFTLTDAFPRRRSVFCDTVRQRALRAPPPLSRGILPCGVRTFLSRGTCVPASECAHLEDAAYRPFFFGGTQRSFCASKKFSANGDAGTRAQFWLSETRSRRIMKISFFSEKSR